MDKNIQCEKKDRISYGLQYVAEQNIKIAIISIGYTCIGTLEIPDMDLIPENNVKIHTRQGVDVHFDTRACVAV